jgi:hypothetical protein
VAAAVAVSDEAAANARQPAVATALGDARGRLGRFVVVGRPEVAAPASAGTVGTRSRR